MAEQPNALPDPADLDPQETKEWTDALEGVITQEGAERAHYLIEKLIGQGRNSPESMEGRGRPMDQMPARVRASLRMQARELYEPKLLKMVAEGTVDRSEYKAILADLIDEALPDLAEAAGWTPQQQAPAYGNAALGQGAAPVLVNLPLSGEATHYEKLLAFGDDERLEVEFHYRGLRR